jgi:DNA-binding transcriptional MocR family regulator
VALPDELAHTLLESIADRQFPVESVLPSQWEFALKYGMSRFGNVGNDDALLDVVATLRSA